jgi:BirA family biotin operon repressor/biotin-[acetyl-CoA-carboxylase] ligase
MTGSRTTTILGALYRATGDYVRIEIPGAELAELARLGYDIETHPHRGHRLLNSPDKLMADDLLARCSGTVTIGREILVFQETASTNDVVARLAPNRAEEGLVVFAETQSKGRGRQGRVWSSPAGKGLWFSVLLRPAFPISRLTVAASVAVARAVGTTARIKWPNDVTVGGRKVAGILTEAREGTAILGIGVNVNCRPEDFPADLRGSAGSVETADRPGFAVRLLRELDATYRQATHHFAAIIAEWAGRSTTLGKQLVVRAGDRRIAGQALALDEDGALLIRRDHGGIERVVGAEVTVETP